jgi:predicted AAA+ superfamily ATPase
MNRAFEDLLTSRVNEKYPLVQVIVGPRQIGKTTGARAVFDSWQGAKFYHTADSPTPLTADWLEARWLQARAVTSPVLLVIDEIQKVLGWSDVVKRLFDEDRDRRDLRVVLLGSASLSLQHGTRESLAGRFEMLRTYHWTLSEHTEQLRWGLEEYLKFGGYPGAARFAADKERWRSYLRDSIIEPVLGRDIVSATPIEKPALLRQAFEIAMYYPAQELSYQKIVGQLQERGSVQTVKRYLEILEGAFLLTQIFRYSTRPLSTRESSPKILTLAPALNHAFVDPMRIETDPDWRGRIFESVVGAKLAQSRGQLYTWRERNSEVDYVLELDGALFAIEVKSGRRLTAKSGMTEFLKRFPRAIPVVVNNSNYHLLLSDHDVADALNRVASN